MSRGKQPSRWKEGDIEPVIGMGATRQVGSDQYPCTVVKVITKNKIVVRKDTCNRNSNDFSISATDKFDLVYTKRSTGEWQQVGYGKYNTGHLMLGVRRFYLDPCF